MKQYLLKITAAIIDFYLLIYPVGIILMSFTMIIGSVQLPYILLVLLLSLLAILFFHIRSIKFNYHSPGEIITGIEKESGKNEFKSPFTISRIPILILVIITLILSGNIMDGLSAGNRYGFFHIMLIGLMFYSIYLGVRNFFIDQKYISIILIIGGLGIQLLLVRAGDLNRGDFSHSTTPFFIGLIVLWLITGIVYKMKRRPLT